MEDIIGVISQGQLIFGRLVFEDSNKMTLKDPRVFKKGAAQGGQGPVSLLAPYIGNPSMVVLNKANIALYYSPTDKQLEAAYISSVSGITIADKMPKAGDKLH